MLSTQPARTSAPLEQWRETSRAQLVEAKQKVSDAEKKLQDTAAATWPQPVHLFAFFPLGGGFVCQSIAERIMDFGAP